MTKLKNTIFNIVLVLSLLAINACISKNEKNEHAGFSFPNVETETFSPDSIKVELDSLMQQIQDVHPSMNMLIDLEELFRV